MRRGLNAVIHGAVYAARGLGCKVVGLREGYHALYPERSPDRGTMELRRPAVRDLSHLGSIVAADIPLVELRAAPNDTGSATLSQVCTLLSLRSILNTGRWKTARLSVSIGCEGISGL